MRLDHCMIAFADGTFYTGCSDVPRTRDVSHAWMDRRPVQEEMIKRRQHQPLFAGAKVIDLYDSLDVLNHLELSRYCAPAPEGLAMIY